MSGLLVTVWIVPIKEDKTLYTLHSNTFKIKTTGVAGAGSLDTVYFYLYIDNFNNVITAASWRFSDWGYYIAFCTPSDYSHKFTTVPQDVVNKEWEVTANTDGIKILCNGLEVLHFIYNDT